MMGRQAIAGAICILAAATPAWAGSLDAQLQWSRRVELSLPVSGVVQEVRAEAGQRVSKGQLLLALDAAPFAASVLAAEAAVARCRLDLKEASRDHAQARELYARTVLSTVELENAALKQSRAEAACRSAQADLEQARYRQRVSALRAPFDAWVLARSVEPGQSVVAELKPPTLLVLAAAGEYLARAEVAADDARTLKLGQAVTVSVAGRRYQGEIKAMALEPAANGRYPVDARFATDDALRTGQSARIEW